MTEQEVTMFEDYLRREYDSSIAELWGVGLFFQSGRSLKDELEKAFMAGRKSVESD